MEFWELEDHEVAYSWLQAFRIIPRNGVLETRGLWPAVGSGHSKSCPGMESWELEDHEVRYCWQKGSPRFSAAPFRHPPRPPLGSHDAFF
eukprot:8193692-Pyramimonas_sp.AAC.1